jgi:hypothetical protein
MNRFSKDLGLFATLLTLSLAPHGILSLRVLRVAPIDIDQVK